MNSAEDIKQYQNKVEELAKEVLKPAFTQIQISSEARAFDNPLHLYKPLVYIGKSYENLIKVSPIALDASEKQFLEDVLYKDEFWITQIEFEDEEIEKYISIVKETPDTRRVLYLKNKIAELSTQGKDFQYEAIEYIELVKKLKE